MNRDEVLEMVHQFRVRAGMNRCYYRILARRWAWADRAVRIIVGLVALASVICALSPGAGAAGLWVSIAGLAAAIVLNVVPLEKWARDADVLGRQWNEVRSDADRLESRVESSTRVTGLADRMDSLQERIGRIESDEPMPDRRLLERCLEDETEQMYGKGIRTPEQAAAFRARFSDPSSGSD